MATHEIFAKDEAGTLKKCIITAPVGSVIAYPVDSVPAHCLECNGALISRTAYPELFAVLGTVYGAGDGGTTFAVPDFRDKFLRGAGGANGAAIGAAQGDAIRNIVGSFSLHGGNPSGAGRGIIQETSGVFSGISPQDAFAITTAGTGATSYHTAEMDASSVVPTAAETRPVNYAVKYCIIYE